jgi:anti-sigma factor RsiW/streptogramin lyase
MGLVHVSSEELSALLDGELSPAGERRARQHLAECPACSAEYALGLRLDQELRQPPVLSCDSVVELLSASLDQQASEPEQAAAQRHLSACADCQSSVREWADLSATLRALPVVAPSARVDRAVRGLVERRRAPRTAPAGGFAARGLIALTGVLAVLVAGLNTGARAPTASLAPTGERALVAAVQQVVFNSRNNTLYMLDVASAAVDALEPGTNELKARISVGGEPTALALNESANTILVLDASQKRVTEIDAGSNLVIGTTPVAVAGTPTSISVDPAGSNIVVTTVNAPRTPAEKSPAGSVAVINGATKQLQTVREINVAPRLVIPDPNRGRSALVSADATTIVDATYSVVETLPGGVSAAFSRRGDNVAVLSATGPDSLVSFAGFGAPAPLKLSGAPSALTSLPDGGYLVLVTNGGVGNVVRIRADGRLAGSVEVAVTGGDLLHDATTGRFTVASAGRVDTGETPRDTVAASAPARSAGPSIAAPLSTASASPSQALSASSEPAAASSAGPTTSAATVTGNLFDRAQPLAPSLQTIPLPNGIKPQVATVSGSRIWFVDESNGVHSFNMGTGELLSIGELRADARISFWVASPSYVFAVDALNGQISVVNIARQRIDAYATNVLKPVSAVAVGPDERLWLALRDADYLFAFDPKRRGHMDAFDLRGARLSALTIDPQGRMYFADDVRGTVGTFDPRTSLLNEFGFAKGGVTTSLLVDDTSTLWLGTSAGEVYAVRGGGARLAVTLQRPVTSLALGHTGRAWYLAPLPSGLGGYIYAPADGSLAPRSVAGPALSLSFNPLGRAFLTDPRGGFYMSTEGAR